MQYHPPRQPWVSDEDFEKYSSVVATAYELHDQMLGTLLAKARAKAGGEDKLNVVLDVATTGFTRITCGPGRSRTSRRDRPSSTVRWAFS